MEERRKTGACAPRNTRLVQPVRKMAEGSAALDDDQSATAAKMLISRAARPTTSVTASSRSKR